jgi:hypothetical protein
MAAISTTGSERSANSTRSFFSGRPDVVIDIACGLRVARDQPPCLVNEWVCVQDLVVSAAECISGFFL